MKYLELLWALEVLAKYYPKYHSSEVLVLADDVWKWLNNELPEDSSTLAYLNSMFDSPADAFRSIWKEVQMVAGPFMVVN